MTLLHIHWLNSRKATSNLLRSIFIAPAFLSFFLLSGLHFEAKGQLDSVSITDMVFEMDLVPFMDTIVELPVLKVTVWVNDIDSLGTMTVDVLDAISFSLVSKKEYTREELISLGLWTESGAIIKMPFLDPEGTFQVKVTVQNWRFYYLPQLVYTYPQ